MTSIDSPPYQYMNKNLLVNRSGDLRVPDAEEREMMLGFPGQIYF